MKARARLLVMGALVLLAGACSFNYQEAMVKESLEESIPDTVLLNFKHYIYRNGIRTASIEADRAELYDKRKETLLEGVHLVEYDDAGEMVDEVWADRAVYHSDTGDADITGEIYLYSEREKAEMVAQSLHWNKEQRLLTSDPEETVSLRKDDGSRIEGVGFQADFRTNALSFSKRVEGVYVYDENEE